MTLPTSTTPWVAQALIQVLSQAAGVRAQAVNALATLQAGPVTSTWVFNVVDEMRDAISRFNQFRSVTGLNAYATAQIPGYSGSLTADIATTQAAIQACIDWIVTNFPRDPATNTWLLAFQMPADGTRTPRSFSTAQTAGLQTLLAAVIATVSA